MHTQNNLATNSDSLRQQIETRPAHGVWAASLSPQTKGLEVDSDQYIAHIKW